MQRMVKRPPTYVLVFLSQKKFSAAGYDTTVIDVVY